MIELVFDFNHFPFSTMTTTKEPKHNVLLSRPETTTGDKIAGKTLKEKQMGSAQSIDTEPSELVGNRRFARKQILRIIEEEDSCFREESIYYYRNQNPRPFLSRSPLSRRG